MRSLKEIYCRISLLERLGRLVRRPVLIKELVFVSPIIACGAWVFFGLEVGSSDVLPLAVFLLFFIGLVLFQLHFKVYRETWALAGGYFGRARELRRIFENLESGTGEFEFRYELKKELEKENLNRANALEWVLGDREAY